MSSPLVLIGLNYQKATIDIREKVSFTPEEVKESLPKILECTHVDEAVLLSTCNRTEIIIHSADPLQAQNQIIEFFAEKGQLRRKELEPSLYKKYDSKAVQHIFKVASGLDSMVLGEPQVVSQVKEAFETAMEKGAAKNGMVELYRYTQQTAKKVRTETGIAKNAVSISFAAVELARKVFKTLKGKKALLVGAGEMCQLAAKHFNDHGIISIDVVNRTFSKAEELAQSFNGKPYGFEDLYQAMETADIILSSTGATEPIILAGEIKKLMKKRNYAPLFIIDIAVPRDVETKAGKISDVYLFDIDNLEQVVEANKEKRKKEALKALDIIDIEVDEYYKWCKIRKLKNIIVDLRKQAEETRKQELEKSLKKLKDCPDNVKKEMERLSKSLMNKMLHQPISGLKKTVAEEKSENKTIGIFKNIFDLE